MTTKHVERVARAMHNGYLKLCEAESSVADSVAILLAPWSPPFPWDSLGLHHQRLYRALARAAIAEMKPKKKGAKKK